MSNVYDRTFLWKYRGSLPEVFFKKVFLEISQNSQESTCARVFLLINNRLWLRCFPVNFAKFLRIYFFYKTPLVAASEPTSFNYILIKNTPLGRNILKSSYAVVYSESYK